MMVVRLMRRSQLRLVVHRKTMQSIDLIRDNLKKSEARVLTRIEEMREHCVVFPTHIGGCHTLWVLSHLAYLEALIIRTFMLGERRPMASKIRSEPTAFACSMWPTTGTCIADTWPTPAEQPDWNECGCNDMGR